MKQKATVYINITALSTCWFGGISGHWCSLALPLLDYVRGCHQNIKGHTKLCLTNMRNILVSVYMSIKLMCNNNVYPRDAVWRHRPGSTFTQVMACCLTAPGYYLNQCWLIICQVMCHSHESNCTVNYQDIWFEVAAASPRPQDFSVWVPYISWNIVCVLVMRV